MPKIQKQFHLEITVEQFLNACSHIELQEVNLLLDGYLKKAEHEARRQAYRTGADPEEIESLEAEEVETDIVVDELGREWHPLKRWSSADEIAPLRKRKRLGFDEDF